MTKKKMMEFRQLDSICDTKGIQWVLNGKTVTISLKRGGYAVIDKRDNSRSVYFPYQKCGYDYFFNHTTRQIKDFRKNVADTLRQNRKMIERMVEI